MRCVVPNCDRDSMHHSQEITYHMFPSEPMLRAAWLEALHMSDWQLQLQERSAICCSHFRPEDLLVSSSGRREVRAGAVPVVDAQMMLNYIKSVKRPLSSNSNSYNETGYDLKEKLTKENILHVSRQDVAESQEKYVDIENGVKQEMFYSEDTSNDIANMTDSYTNIVKYDIKIENEVQHDNILKDIKLEGQLLTTHKDTAEDDASIATGIVNHKQLRITLDLIPPGKNRDPLSLNETDYDQRDSDFESNHTEKESMCDSKEGLKQVLQHVDEDNIKIEDENNTYVTSNYNESIAKVEVKIEYTDAIHGVSNDEGSHNIRVCSSSLPYFATDEHENKDNDMNEDRSIEETSAVDKGHRELLTEPARSHSVEKPTREDDINKSNLTKDMVVNLGEKKFSCMTCNKAYKRKSHLTRHLRIHTREKPFSCEICNEAFYTRFILTRHLKSHSGDKPFPCYICNKAFNYKSNLITHLRTHTGTKPFSCNLCNKAFNCKGNLKTHLGTHTGEKPFSCNTCNKAFKRKSHLTGHLKIHYGEKPFSCEICNKAFYTRSILTSHLRSHTGDKPFSCDICNKAFNCISHLITHFRIHTGEKPFSCKLCNKAFNCKSNLITHLRTHTDEKPFSCDLCNKSFNCKSNLITHLRTHTGK